MHAHLAPIEEQVVLVHFHQIFRLVALYPALLDLSLDQVESDAHSVVLVQECLRLYVVELGQLGVQSLVLLYLNLLKAGS